MEGLLLGGPDTPKNWVGMKGGEPDHEEERGGSVR